MYCGYYLWKALLQRIKQPLDSLSIQTFSLWGSNPYTHAQELFCKHSVWSIDELQWCDVRHGSPRRSGSTTAKQNYGGPPDIFRFEINKSFNKYSLIFILSSTGWDRHPLSRDFLYGRKIFRRSRLRKQFSWPLKIGNETRAYAVKLHSHKSSPLTMFCHRQWQIWQMQIIWQREKSSCRKIVIKILL